LWREIYRQSELFKIATPSKRDGVELEWGRAGTQVLVQKYGFKGVWDANGKVVKHEIRNK
jgi:hypothetical protein